MIFCDVDNITEENLRPSQEVIENEMRRQLEALKDIRRRLREVIGPRLFPRILQTR